VQLAYINGVSTTPTKRKQLISVASHRERIFCMGCNKHFKDLEDEAIPILEWMARGRAISLGEAEQEILARWGAKTGFALIAAERELRTLVPSEHMAHLRFQNEPHAMNWVGYASWSGHVFKAANRQRIHLTGDDQVVFRAYHEVLAFQHLAFKLFGLIDLIPGYKVEGDWPGLKQVWPRATQPISWPLALVANDYNWVALSSAEPLRRDD
jgi:hypothetical protein